MRELGFDDETIARYSYNKYNGKSDYEANSKEALENHLLDMYLAVITNANTFNEVRQPLDTVTDYLKNNILSDVDSLTQQSKASSSSPLYYVTPQFQSKTKSELSGGKRGIGPFALAASHHALTQQVGLTLANNEGSKILRKFGITNVSGISSLRNNHAPGYKQINTNILDWLSAMINAHVDVAKDPYIIRLNVRSLTYNMTNFLLRTGVGESTFYFLPQQILKDFAVEYDKYAGFYGVDLPAYANPESTAHRAVFNKYMDAASKLATTPAQKSKLADFKKNPQSFLTEELLDIDWLRRQLDVKNDSYKSFNWYFNQLRVLALYDAFTPASRSLSALTTLSQIDTKKFGNNFGLQSSFLVRWKKFVQEDKTFVNPLSMFINTFLYQKLVDGILFPRNAFKNVMLRLTPEFEIWRNKLHAMTGTLGSSNNDTINSITRAMEAQYKAAFFNDYCIRNNIVIKDLLYGKDSIVNRFYILRNKILRNEYPSLLDSTGKLENVLLNSLAPRQKYDRLQQMLPDFFELKMNKDGNDGMDDLLIRAWEELLDSEYKEVRDFARDLAIYAFYTSGDAFGRNNFFKYVPNSLRESMGYFDYIRNLETDPANLGQFAAHTSQIFRNLWWNEDIVPTIEYSKPETVFDETTGEVYQTDGRLPNQESDYEILTDDGKLLSVPGIVMNTRRPKVIGINESSDTVYTPYIKIRLNGDLDPRYTMLYRFIGVAKQGNAEYPVYRLIPKLGVNMQGMTLLEFGKAYSDIGANNYYYKGSVDESIFPEFRPIKDIVPTSVKNQVDVFNFLNDVNRMIERQSTESAESSDIDDIRQYLAPGEEANDMIRETVELANEGLKITSELGEFFTKEEQDEIREATKNKRLFVKSASRRTDPVFFTENLINQLKENAKLPFGSPNRFYAMEIWTKHDGLPLVDLINACIKYRVAPMLSFSITTLGNTELEPGVMKADDLLDRIGTLINQGKINPNTTTVRIDPIIPGVTKFEDIEHVVDRSSKLGITKFVSSVMQSYGYTENTANPRGVVPTLIQRINYNWDLYYGTNRNGIINFRPKAEHVKPIGDFLKSLITKYGVKIESCASNDLGLPESACLDPIIIERVTGVQVDATFKDKTRPNCMCYGAHGDMLKYSDVCASCCAYCYGAQQNNEIPYRYYDERGNLVDFYLTRTSRGVPTAQPTYNNRYIANYYTGDIVPDENTIFVFGSNPEGRHGAGAAKIAREKFGAIYGQGEGLQGNSYALPTKDLRVKENRGLKSIPEDQIIDNIKRLYDTARQNPDKQFKIAYRNTDKASLNGYTGLEMIDMFIKAGSIPSNIYFSEEWINTGKFNNISAQSVEQATQTLAETWSQKEGWSVNHFYSEVLPKIDKAWQIEFELAPDQSVKADYTGKMDMDYKGNTREGIQSTSTIEAIKRGERTATTRYERPDKPEYIEYWKQAKVGDVIEWKRGDESVKVIVTKPLTKLTEQIPSQTEDQTQSQQIAPIIPNDLRQVRINVPGTDVPVTRLLAEIESLRDAENIAINNNEPIDSTINYGVLEDWQERKRVSDLLSNQQILRDVNDILSIYEKENKGTDFSELSDSMRLSEILTNILVNSGAYVREDPNQLSLFSETESQLAKDFDEFVRETSDFNNTQVLEQVRSEIPQAAKLASNKKEAGYTFTFKNGFEISLPFKLNEQQVAALYELESFVNDPTSTQFTLSGYAGTGKTTVMGIFNEYLKDQGMRVVFTAPTHRANAVTRSKTPDAVVMTLARLFGLSVEVDLGANNYDLRTLEARQTNDPKIQDGEIIVIDEASMVQDGMYDFIQEAKQEYPNTKIIYVGDAGQLRPVKSDTISKVFTEEDTPKMQLTKVERTGDNPILEEATRVRNGEDFSYQTKLVNGEGVTFTTDRNQISSWVTAQLKSPQFESNKQYFKVLAGTNAQVESWNKYCRRVLFGSSAKLIMPGELITGYANALMDRYTGEYQFMNSVDYVVTQVSDSSVSFTVGNDTLRFNTVKATLKDTFNINSEEFSMNFIVPGQDAGLAKLKRFIDDRWEVYRRAKATGQRAIARQALNEINAIKNNMFLLENAKDANGRLIFQKTADYGYAVTVHKSQSGTFNKVLIDEKSIHAFNNTELERELKYVAISRASEDAMVITDSTYSPTNQTTNENVTQIMNDEATAFVGIQPNAQASADLNSYLASLGLDTSALNELDSLGVQRKNECK